MINLGVRFTFLSPRISGALHVNFFNVSDSNKEVKTGGGVWPLWGPQCRACEVHLC